MARLRVGHGYASGCDCVVISSVNANGGSDDGVSLIVALCEKEYGSGIDAHDADICI